MLDVAVIVDLSLSLSGEPFLRCLSLSQTVTHDETVRVARSVLCEIIADKT